MQFKDRWGLFYAYSLSEISRILGYDRKVLQANFPDTCRRIINSHKEFCFQLKENRRELLRNQVLNVVEGLEENGVYPSVRKIESVMNKPALLHEAALRSVLNMD